jgi:hypothetical protein
MYPVPFTGTPPPFVLPNTTNVPLYPFSFHRVPHSLRAMEIRNPFLINHFRTLSHATEGGGKHPLFHRVTSHGSPATMLQICTFSFNNFHDAPPATPFFSCFCIVAGGLWGSQVRGGTVSRRMRGVLRLYQRPVTGRPQGRRGMPNSRLSLRDAKASRFRAVGVCGDVCGACVSNACKSGANFRAAERCAAEPNGEAALQRKRASGASKSTNGEVLQPEGTSRAASGDTARVPAPQLEGRAGHRPGNCLGRRRRRALSRLFALGSHSLSAGRVSLSLR